MKTEVYLYIKKLVTSLERVYLMADEGNWRDEFFEVVHDQDFKEIYNQNSLIGLLLGDLDKSNFQQFGFPISDHGRNGVLALQNVYKVLSEFNEKLISGEMVVKVSVRLRASSYPSEPFGSLLYPRAVKIEAVDSTTEQKKYINAYNEETNIVFSGGDELPF